jgi:hypothetical protein
MPIQHAHTYLVHPGRGAGAALPIKESQLPLSGKLFGLLAKIYDNAESECTLGILFNHSSGRQQNDCRDLFVSYATGPTLARGRKIAERLQQKSDARSGIGLMFLVAGTDGNGMHKLLVARFSTDNGVLADENAGTLTVTFLERIFMRNSKSYKAVCYTDRSINAGFWEGRAVDRQINSGLVEVSQYWITDFLVSRLVLTPARGTTRLAHALKQAIKTTRDPAIHDEIMAAAKLVSGLHGKNLSIEDIFGRFNLSSSAIEAVGDHLPPGISDEKFRFDAKEYIKLVAFRSIKLDNGVTIMADATDFDEVVQQRQIRGSDEVEFSTRGRIIDESLERPRG